jgi:hypothetical protein
MKLYPRTETLNVCLSREGKTFMKLNFKVLVFSVLAPAFFSSHASALTVYNIKNVYSDMCLNVLNYGLENGADIVQAQDCSISSSKFELVPRGEGYYNIKALHSGQCVNVLNYAWTNGADVVQAVDCDLYSSQWKLVRLADDSYNIVARHSGQCLNVLNWGNFNGANVVQAQDCNVSTSRWTFWEQ